MIRRSYGDRMQCWPSGINCQNFVLDKGTISLDKISRSFLSATALLAIFIPYFLLASSRKTSYPTFFIRLIIISNMPAAINKQANGIKEKL